MDMIRPRWITNCDSAAALLYAFLPCQRSICLVYLNSFIETSDAKAAWLPSLPTMPKPIDANWIMPTSLPPSPMPALLIGSVLHDGASHNFEFLCNECLLGGQASATNDSRCLPGHFEEQA